VKERSNNKKMDIISSTGVQNSFFHCCLLKDMGVVNIYFMSHQNDCMQ